jgi:hypothetical protein
MKLKCGLGAVLFGLLAAVAAAQSSGPVPDVHIGDTWKFRSSDGFTGELTAEFTQQVVDVNDREIVVQLHNLKSDKRVLRYFNRQWNVLDVGNAKYEPYYPDYKFPLSVGMTWNGKYTYSGDDGAIFTGYVTAKVATLEKVTVPAGTFDAYRIDGNVETRSTTANAQLTTIRTTTWYAQAVQRFVRRDVVTTRDGRVRSKTVDELVEYDPASRAKSPAN